MEKIFKNIKYLILVSVLIVSSMFYFGVETESVKAENIELYNNAIFVTFEDENYETWLNETPSGYDNNYYDLYNYCLNESPNSVYNYYQTMSYQTLSLKTNLYVNSSNNAFVVPYTLNELLPYSPDNTAGYFEYEGCSYTTASEPSLLSYGYFNSSEHLYNIYYCSKANSRHSTATCDLDLSDGIGCKCAWDSYVSSNSTSNLVLYEHAEHYFRLMIALKSALKQASSAISSNTKLDYNNDGYIDAISFIFPYVEGNKINWGDLLWAHQGTMEYLEYVSSYFGNASSFLEKFQDRGLSLRVETEEYIDNLLDECKINNKAPGKYICLTTDHLVSTSPLTDDNNVKTLTNFVFAHELSHSLGLPDYYVYDNDKDDSPVSYWDLMGYNYNGFPIYLSTYSREKLGFLNENNIQTITSSGTYTLKPTTNDEVNSNSTNSNNVLAYVVEDPNFPQQKIYIEFRYKLGKYDKAYSNNGLIIYRIDDGVVQTKAFQGLTSAGNFYGYPYNFYVFKKNGKSSFNNLNNSFGNSDTNSTYNAITFQSYDDSKNQQTLVKNDVTFINSGLVIDNIIINNITKECSFRISGGNLLDKDFNTIKLNGESSVNVEVNTAYTDEYINFGDFTEDEFDIDINNTLNINKLGDYSITYTLTHKTTQTQKVLTRTIIVLDTTSPTLTLLGDLTVYCDSLENFEDPRYEVSDNYDSSDSINVERTISKDNDLTNSYTITYTATDSSGNKTTKTRTLKISELGNVSLNGEEEVILDVFDNYTDLGLSFNNTNENNFSISITNAIDNSTLGNYTYTYIIIEKSTTLEKTLTRFVAVKDRISPTLTILENVEVYLDQLESTLENDTYTYSDNYDSTSNITFERNVDRNNERVIITYTAKDKSNNSITKQRIITIKYIQYTSQNTTLTIQTESLDNKYYVNSAIKVKVEIETLSQLENERLEPISSIKWYVDGELQPAANNILSNLSFKFNQAGTHNIELCINDKSVLTKQIQVVSFENDSEVNGNNATIILIIIIVGLIAVAVIPVAMAINRKRNDLDKY